MPRIYSTLQRSLLRPPLLAALLAGASLQAVEIVGHRGASYDAPENTLAATRLAWEQGADAVETDIYLTKDGKIIVAHDKTGKRTTGRDVAFADLTQAEARELDAGSWKHSKFQGEKLPLLEEQITSIPPGKRLLVEIKTGPEIVPELARVFKKTGATARNITVISFNLASLQAVRQQLPWTPTLWLVGHPPSTAKPTPSAKSPPGIDQLIRQATGAKLTGLDLQYTWPLTAADLASIRASGLQLHVWTVDDPAIARQWTDFGVASITTNRPGWLREQLRK